MSKLALFGGKPIRSTEVPLEDVWPETMPEDLDAVNRVFESGHFTAMHSEEVPLLEEEYGQYVGTRYALALGTGTAALHTAVAAAGCQPGDEVIVPALTFLASATAVMHQVAIPVFADIDPITYNIDPASVEQRISSRTRAIMAVDMHGLPADYDALQIIADKHNIVIIDDAAHAMGATYKGRKVGSLADITGTSIMPAKQFPTCGEGGLFSTNNVEYYNRASMVRMFGEVIKSGKKRAYNAVTLGWNYRIGPVEAAYARSQLRRLDRNAAIFSQNGAHLTAKLNELKGIIPPFVPNDYSHVYHMYRIKFSPEQLGFDIHPGRFAQAVDDVMAAEGLPLRFYQNLPVPGQMIFRLKEGFGQGIPWTLPGARDVNYDIEDYPITLDALETTRCIGKSGSSGPNYFRNRKIMDLYIEGFYKVWENLDEVYEHARAIDYNVPWSSIAPSTRGVWTVFRPQSRDSG